MFQNCKLKSVAAVEGTFFGWGDAVRKTGCLLVSTAVPLQFSAKYRESRLAKNCVRDIFAVEGVCAVSGYGPAAVSGNSTNV